jgi:sulfatase modifying factor 1
VNRMSSLLAALLLSAFTLPQYLHAQTTNADYDAGFEAGRLAGRADVTNNPTAYRLYTKSQFNANRFSGRADVTNNPAAYRLISRTNIPAVRFAAAKASAFSLSLSGSWTRYALSGAPAHWTFNTNTGDLSGVIPSGERTVRLTPYDGSQAGPQMTIQLRQSAPPTPTPTPTPTPPPATNNMPMVVVQGGTMPMFSALAGSVISTFQIGKYEVTWDEWQEVRAWAATNGYTDLAAVGVGSAGNHPVRNVNWYDVVKWMNAKSEREALAPVYWVGDAVYRTGQTSPLLQTNANGYRLPTDPEWEWAARGGLSSQSYIYSGSNDAKAVAWTWENSSGALVNISYNRGTWPVGQKAANELGLYDMSGNVWEWCEDFVSSISARRIRGASWREYMDSAYVSNRNNSVSPDARVSFFGFRAARNAP